MKLQHYLGGLEGLPEPLDLEKRVFVEDWEKRIFGIHVAMMALSTHLGSAAPRYPITDVPTDFHHKWTWADLRTGAEGMHPFDYFKYRYYEKWLGGITQFFLDSGYLTEDELRSRIEESDAAVVAPEVDAAAIDAQVVAYLRQGDDPRRDVAHPQFTVGQVVRVANPASGAHTRLPGYLRGRIGEITHVFEGDYAYFNHTGDGIGDPMPIYVVEFRPDELWGPTTEPGLETVYAELFEAYLEEEPA
jgi:nitrile hydratase